MKRTHRFANLCMVGVLSAGVVATSGCGRSDESAREAGATGTADHTQAQAPGMPEHGQDLTVTGCLTANVDGRSYALTPSDTAPSAAGQAMSMPGRNTVTYELVGNTEEFRPHTNMLVTARGREDAAAMRDTQMEREDEGKAGGAQVGEGTPTVETKEEVDVRVRRLHVTSVVATGSGCPSLGPTDGRATGAPSATGGTGAGTGSGTGTGAAGGTGTGAGTGSGTGTRTPGTTPRPGGGSQ